VVARQGEVFVGEAGVFVAGVEVGFGTIWLSCGNEGDDILREVHVCSLLAHYF
jgi:hypothetical protein